MSHNISREQVIVHLCLTAHNGHRLGLYTSCKKNVAFLWRCYYDYDCDD